MDIILKSIGTLCIMGYVSGLLLNFTSTDYTQRSIKLITALYIITAALSPINKIELPDFDFDTITVSYRQSYDYIKNKSEENVKLFIENIFNSKNISYTGVDVHINEENDKLEIYEIVIYGTDKSQEKNILNLMEENKLREYVILEE